ncbi:MAG: hypothetical protein RR654_06960 [Oscillospiraceae bacterium]
MDVRLLIEASYNSLFFACEMWYDNLKAGYRHSASRLQGLRIDFENIEPFKSEKSLLLWRSCGYGIIGGEDIGR